MKNNRNMKRKGFTLVELLIVIVVIGVLSAMMMLSSTEAVTSARASNIVSNLRNLKTAATAMYVDHQDGANALPTTETEYTGTGANSMDVVVKYMNNGGGSSSGTVDSNMKNYGIKKASDNSWFIYIKNVDDTKVQEKLAGRAKSVGLLKTADSDDYYVSGNTAVYMFVLKP